MRSTIPAGLRSWPSPATRWGGVVSFLLSSLLLGWGEGIQGVCGGGPVLVALACRCCQVGPRAQQLGASDSWVWEACFSLC